MRVSRSTSAKSVSVGSPVLMVLNNIANGVTSTPEMSSDDALEGIRVGESVSSTMGMSVEDPIEGIKEGNPVSSTSGTSVEGSIEGTKEGKSDGAIDPVMF